MAGFTLITHLAFLLTWVHHGKVYTLFCSDFFMLMRMQHKSVPGPSTKSGKLWFRLHGVCKENPLAPLIGRLGLPLYRTSEDNSVLYDHDLER